MVIGHGCMGGCSNGWRGRGVSRLVASGGGGWQLGDRAEEQLLGIAAVDWANNDRLVLAGHKSPSGRRAAVRS